MGLISAAFKSLPPIRRLLDERNALRAERDALVKANGHAPPGHFYSPVVSVQEALRDADRLFDQIPRQLPGITLNESAQLALLERIESYYPAVSFPAEKQAGHRYYFENPAYSYSDAIFLQCMMRHLAPRRFIEVGSGFSSCAALDTSERFLGGSVDFTFVEPYPELLLSLITAADRNKVQIIPTRLQDTAVGLFETRAPNDILFIDSTHVCKTGSDVNFLFSDILPALQSGVYIHIHDIFYPFEYPKEWIMDGRSWNEAYQLRAFLQYNASFEIVIMNTFLEHFHEEWFQHRMPLCLKDRGGSIWIQRL